MVLTSKLGVPWVGTAAELLDLLNARFHEVARKAKDWPKSPSALSAQRRRLAPSVSPGKSVEGAFGGLVGGALGALAVRQLGMPDMPALHAAALGVGVAAAGIVGDLGESLLKRWAGVKDSGTLFPGHGGMLDRIDSLLFGAPVLYYYFSYVR